MEKIELFGKTIEFISYENKEDLISKDKSTYEKVKNSVFYEFDEMMSSIMGQMPGFVLYGDVFLDKNDDPDKTKMEHLGELLGKTHKEWFIFTGNLENEGHLEISDFDRVSVLGDFKTDSLVNDQGLFWADGESHIQDGLYFDSNNGGFTLLNLKTAPGLIATMANVFEVNLKSKYFYDPIFRIDFKDDPQSPHQENILSKLDPEHPHPTKVTKQDLVDFLGHYEKTEEVTNLENEDDDDVLDWIMDLVSIGAAGVFVEFLDKKYSKK